MDDKRIELLSPAKDLACGIAAINCGADAVYIGAPRYGARESACNPVHAIADLCRHAHLYWAKVYVTMNTLLRDDELALAVRQAWRLRDAGIDGFIIQDMGLLEWDLPPLPLIASTQAHNMTPEKVKFFEDLGFHRVILARELDLEQIKAIRRAAPRIELECFVHGALCVGFSGQCYLSYAQGGRSGNRGQCAQPCRKFYELVDEQKSVLAKGHLLSLHDLNLTDHLAELIDAGITSFKIEGRLKDEMYVKNVTAHYRAKLDEVIEEERLTKSSSGSCTIDFEPNVAKTFNRGYTDYFLHGKQAPVGFPDTPKMLGEWLGVVTEVRNDRFVLRTEAVLHAGDGLCFFDEQRRLQGTFVNRVKDGAVIPRKMDGIKTGATMYRNHDHAFLTALKNARPERHIDVSLLVRNEGQRFLIRAADEDGVEADYAFDYAGQPADKPEQALENIRKQLSKMGGTEFKCAGVEIQLDPVYFLPVSTLNALRREVLENLRQARKSKRPTSPAMSTPSTSSIPYPETALTYQGNVLNKHAEQFYRCHGVVSIEPAAEAWINMRGCEVMRTRYCIRHQLDMCGDEAPLWLVDEEGHRLKVEFECGRCGMRIVF